MATIDISKAKPKTRAKKKLNTNEHLKKVQPVLGDLGGAVTGGVLGALAPPVVSGFGGVALLITGAYTQKSWVTSTGAAMIVTTVTNCSGSNYRTSPTGKMDPKTELHNGKERVKTFLKSFGGKFRFWKKKPADAPVDDPAAEFLNGLGMADAEHLANLDQLNRNLIAEGYELAATEGYPTAYTMEYPGEVVHF